MYYYKKRKIENVIAHICNCEYMYFLNKANVVGVGCGYKIKSGFYSNQLCIQVFVNKKLPSNEIRRQDIIPNIYKGIPTDVTESGIFKCGSLTSKIRPTIGGYCIGNEYENMDTGTLGCLVTDGKDLFILSNNHVIASCNKAPISTKIIQPSFSWGGSFETDVIAILSKYIPIKFVGIIKIPSNYVDCAIGKVINKSVVSPRIALVGFPEENIIPRLYESVKKAGYKTELTTGMIISIHNTIKIGFGDAGKIAVFKEQILTTKMSEGGDSGSILLDKNNHVIGLLVSDADTHSTFNPINTVLKELNVRIVTQKNYY